MPEFQATMEEFHRVMGELALYTMGLLHDVLNLSAESAKIMTGAPNRSAVRLNHYPVGDPVPENQRSGLAQLGETALGDHTDPGVITLLLQDSIGGLQTRTREGEWIDVEPQPGTIVVNLGDVMQVWTNDR
jgi:isopenicillin N synthase-like dioxygenase